MDKKFWIKKIIGFAIVAMACLALLSWVVLLLWNHVLAEVVPGILTVNYWQALGILTLSKILFGGIGGSRDYKQQWKKKMEQKFKKLSPEERAQIKEEWRNRCRVWRKEGNEQNEGTE